MSHASARRCSTRIRATDDRSLPHRRARARIRRRRAPPRHPLRTDGLRPVRPDAFGSPAPHPHWDRWKRGDGRGGGALDRTVLCGPSRAKASSTTACRREATSISAARTASASSTSGTPLFGLTPRTTTTYDLHRLLFEGDLHVSDRFRTFIQFSNHQVTSASLSPGTDPLHGSRR